MYASFKWNLPHLSLNNQTAPQMNDQQELANIKVNEAQQVYHNLLTVAV